MQPSPRAGRLARFSTLLPPFPARPLRSTTVAAVSAIPSRWPSAYASCTLSIPQFSLLGARSLTAVNDLAPSKLNCGIDSVHDAYALGQREGIAETAATVVERKGLAGKGGNSVEKPASRPARGLGCILCSDLTTGYPVSHLMQP